MCRLFAYAASRSQSLLDVMGAQDLAEFSDLSRLHDDGWGAAWLRGPADDEAYQPTGSDQVRTDVGTTIARLRSTLEACGDPAFDHHARAARSTAALLHLRRASAGMAVDMTNQHPFTTYATPLPGGQDEDDAAFAHNGTIGWTPALTALGARHWRAAGIEAPAIVGTTDSERFLWLIRAWHAEGATWPEAMAQACRAVRRHTEPCALNSMLLTSGYVIAVHASGGTRLEWRRPLDSLPRDHAEAYYDMWLRRDDQAVAVTSSGIEVDGWQPVSDETMVVIDTATLGVTESPVEA
ncbi:MAG: class II glutamine amidotransferase [Propionibacteriaceae bacterium]|nr:class II glutamine amidotransferase [Propionibacteriaceae bacterium]